jgi:hypothetical protein
MLEAGFDVNDMRMLRWFHTKVDRVAYILFKHLQNARKRGLATASIFEDSIALCLRWFYGLEGQERYREWVSRLGKSGPGPSSETATDEDDNEAKERRAVSKGDRQLAKVGRGPMQNVDDAVLSLLAEEERAMLEDE